MALFLLSLLCSLTRPDEPTDPFPPPNRLLTAAMMAGGKNAAHDATDKGREVRERAGGVRQRRERDDWVTGWPDIPPVAVRLDE